MKKINVMVVLSLILLATSCTTVKVQNSAKKVAPVNSIALFPTMIGSLKKINYGLVMTTVAQSGFRFLKAMIYKPNQE